MLIQGIKKTPWAVCVKDDKLNLLMFSDEVVKESEELGTQIIGQLEPFFKTFSPTDQLD